MIYSYNEFVMMSISSDEHFFMHRLFAEDYLSTISKWLKYLTARVQLYAMHYTIRCFIQVQLQPAFTKE